MTTELANVERLESKDALLADEGLSYSALKLANENPQLYEEIYVTKTRPRPSPTKQQEWGSACEAYIRNRGIDDVLIIPPEVLNKDGHRKGKKWLDFAAAHGHHHLATQAEYDEVYGGFAAALRNVQEHEHAKNLVLDGLVYDFERRPPVWHERLAWTCPLTGLRRKCEIDLVHYKSCVAVDLKTAVNLDRDHFAKSAYDFGYDIQAATYLEALEMLTGKSDWLFVWVAIRNTPPHDVEVYEASDEFLNLGRQRHEAYLRRYVEMRESGIWRSETWGRTCTLYPPKWATV